MRASLFYVAIVATLTSVVAADWRDGFNNCAQNCFHSRNMGKCDNDDLKCLCNHNEYLQNVKKCFDDECSDSRQHQARNHLDDLCKASTLCEDIGARETDCLDIQQFH
ncbi:hypothetical protein FRB99_001447 [Tulasnella sp. 403]|nr:hypothetical protein FRB99_001447 [Tulasnella sp. 403]